jgi:hypothetical protein
MRAAGAGSWKDPAPDSRDLPPPWAKPGVGIADTIRLRRVGFFWNDLWIADLQAQLGDRINLKLFTGRPAEAVGPGTGKAVGFEKFPHYFLASLHRDP